MNESKEATHLRFYQAFHAWFMKSGCDFWSECDAPEFLAQLAVEISDELAAQSRAATIKALTSKPEIEDFILGIKLEAHHQRARWGEAHDRGKSAENWYWLIGYLAGKALRSSIDGDRDKALHHTISSAAALLQWHDAIRADASNRGLGDDADLSSLTDTAT